MPHLAWFEDASLWIDQRNSLPLKLKTTRKICRGQMFPGRVQAPHVRESCFAHTLVIELVEEAHELEITR